MAAMIAHARPARDSDVALPDEAFVRLTGLAASLLSVPVAVVRTDGPVHVLATSGDVDIIPNSIVAHVDPFILSADAVDRSVFDDPDRAMAALGLAFHADAVMTTTEGRDVGRFSIFDRVARKIRPPEERILDALAAVAAEEIEVWLAANRARHREQALLDHQQRIIEDSDVLMAAMREVTAYEDPTAVRPAICRIAVSLSGADAAALYEFGDGDAAMIPTATAGLPWVWPTSDISDRSFAPARAFVGGKAVLVEGTGAVGPSARDPIQRGAQFWQPFAAGGSTGAAVVGLAWGDATDISPVRIGRLMDTLAAEGMRAIERADLLVRLEELARTDEMTGLPNRRALNEALDRELQRARRGGHAICVGILDFDHFKRYNDAKGHLAGDRLLADASTAWRDVLRGGTDFLARFGGEEFVVVLPTTMDVAFETLERMRGRTPDGQTISVGLACWDPSETADELLARADVALYAAKAAGRDRIERAPAVQRPEGG
jgi:diguanylate cyclase (GGDEF)-like protein